MHLTASTLSEAYRSLGLLLVLTYAIGALLAAGHALLTKPDPRAAFIWIVLCGLFPLLGALLYLLFGINRVRTRARRLRAGLSVRPAHTPEAQAPADDFAGQLTRIGDAMTGRARLRGNELQALQNGERAYPVMLEAIAHAEHSVWLSTYIFQTDAAGREFIAALAAAA